MNAVKLFAHLSRRLIGELIVYTGIRHLSVVNIFVVFSPLETTKYGLDVFK